MTDLTPPNWILIENDGALFRGPHRASPREVWNPGVGWRPYLGEPSKPVSWGYEITEAEAQALMRALEG